MPHSERSAGFVLFRQTDQGRVYLVLNYGRHWDYAKGHVEAGEDDLSAARRELLEETGIKDVRIVDGFRHEIHYKFKSRNKHLVQKTVVFFLAETPDATVTLSDEHVGFLYLPFELAVNRLTYESAKQMLKQADQWIRETRG